MARATEKENGKVRVLIIYRQLLLGRKITVNQIQRMLKQRYGFTAERKTIYSDIAAINRIVPIRIIHGRNGGYVLWDVLGEAEDGT